jgi:hypothetical protein
MAMPRSPIDYFISCCHTLYPVLHLHVVCDCAVACYTCWECHRHTVEHIFVAEKLLTWSPVPWSRPLPVV